MVQEPIETETTTPQSTNQELQTDGTVSTKSSELHSNQSIEQ